MDQLNLYQVGPKSGSLSMEELYPNIVFKLNLVVRDSWATTREYISVGYTKLG